MIACVWDPRANNAVHCFLRKAAPPHSHDVTLQLNSELEKLVVADMETKVEFLSEARLNSVGCIALMDVVHVRDPAESTQGFPLKFYSGDTSAVRKNVDWAVELNIVIF